MASPGYRRCPQDTAYPQDTDSVLRIPRYPQDTAGVLRYKCPQDAAVSSGYRVPRMPSELRVPGRQLAFSDGGGSLLADNGSWQVAPSRADTALFILYSTRRAELPVRSSDRRFSRNSAYIT